MTPEQAQQLENVYNKLVSNPDIGSLENLYIAHGESFTTSNSYVTTTTYQVIKTGIDDMISLDSTGTFTVLKPCRIFALCAASGMYQKSSGYCRLRRNGTQAIIASGSGGGTYVTYNNDGNVLEVGDTFIVDGYSSNTNYYNFGYATLVFYANS